jgi:hypothetical protein
LGMRGSGKSSLVRAGVLPLLAEVGEANGPWRRAVTRPGPGGAAGDPIDRLAAALLADSALPELETATTHNGRGNLASELREHTDSAAVRLTEVLDQIGLQELDRLLDDEEGESPLPGRIEGVELARHRMLRRVKPKAHLVLVVDQLEDLFATGYTADLQHRYIAALVALIRCQRIFVLATLQSDFYANFQQFSELAEFAWAGGRFDLQPPTREELGNIIRLPAAAAGLRFERDSASGRSLDEALVDAAATNSESLPLLGHLLSQLYRTQLARKDRLLRWSDYKEMGELEGALDNRAETVFKELGSDEQEAFDFVMRRLVSSGSGEGDVRRGVPYRDLVSSPEFDHRQKAGAKGLVDRFIKEELFSAETNTKQEIIVGIAHEVLLKRWRRARLWLAEDQGFLRMRDRLDANLKLWLNRDRRCADLLGPEFGIADAETLLRHFRSALNKTEIDYIQKILAKRKHGRIRNIFVLVVGASLAVLATFAGVWWYNTNIHRKGAVELARFERRQEASQLQLAKDKPPLSEQNANFSVNEGSALETQLALEAELKNAEDKAQAAQQNADLATTQRSAMEAELKKAQGEAQAAQQSADLATAQRSAMEAELKKAKDNAQAAQQNADLAASQRSAMEAELRKTKDNAQAAQQNADLATSQRSALEAELKKAQDNAKAAQQNADLATAQRSTMEAELKKAQDNAKAAQQNADLATSQRSAIEAELKKAEDKAQAAQQIADLAATQHGAFDVELRKASEKAQQAQQIADLAGSQRSAMETELKMAEQRAELAQQTTDLATTQRKAMETELKKAEERVQQAQQIADLAVTQRNEMESELKKARQQLNEAEQTGQTAQESSDFGTNQPKPEPTPSTAISTASTPADPHAGENASGDEQSLKKFVLDYLQTVASDDVSTQENFFSHRVTYYNQGVFSLRKVQEAKQTYDREWPNRDWKPKGEPEIRPTANPKMYEVLQLFTWTASDGSRTDQGSGTLYFRILKNSKGQFHIVHIERHDQ